MSNLDIFLELFSQVCFTIIVVYLGSRLRFFKENLAQHFNTLNRILLVLFFGLLSTYGACNGIELNSGVVINIQNLAPLTAGLIAGPLAGLGAGLIGGISQLYLGGFGAVPNAITTVIIGLGAGVIYYNLRGRLVSVPGAIMLAVAGECFMMGLLLAFARPFDQALLVVEKSAAPIVAVNAAGAGAIMLLVRRLVSTRQNGTI